MESKNPKDNAMESDDSDYEKPEHIEFLLELKNQKQKMEKGAKVFFGING
jgi:hypothetical protein